MFFYSWGIALVIAEIVLVIHAARRDRYLWIYVILFFPVVGSAVYFFLHVLPDFRFNNTIQDTGEKLTRIVAPSKHLLKLKQQLEFSDTLENRQLLAKEYENHGRYDDAITLYESCLEGVYEDDPYILLDLAGAQFMNRSFDEARNSLIKIKRKHPHFINKKKASLLLARAYEELNEVENALAEYKSIAGIYPGEEAKCRYALLLKKIGRIDEAEKIFNEIIYGAGKSPRYYRREQKKWIDLARQNLNEPLQQRD